MLRSEDNTAHQPRAINEAYFRSQLLKLLDKYDFQYTIKFQNFVQSVTSRHAVVIDIEDEERLRFLHEKIHDYNQQLIEAGQAPFTMRYAAGSNREPSHYEKSFSLSDIVGSDVDIVIRTSGVDFRKIARTNFISYEINRDGERVPMPVMSVGPGVKVGEMSKELYETYRLQPKSRPSWIGHITTAGGTGTGVNNTDLGDSTFNASLYGMHFLRLDNARVILRRDEKIIHYPNGVIETYKQGALTTTYPDGKKIIKTPVKTDIYEKDVLTQTLPTPAVESEQIALQLKNLADEAKTIFANHLGLFGAVLQQEFICMPAMKVKTTFRGTNTYHLYRMLRENNLLQQKNILPYITYIPTGRYDKKTHACLEFAESCPNNRAVVINEYVDINTPNENDNYEWEELKDKLEIKLAETFDLSLWLSQHPAWTKTFQRNFAVLAEIPSKEKVVIQESYKSLHRYAFPTNIYDLEAFYGLFKKDNGQFDVEKFIRIDTKLINLIHKYALQGYWPIIYQAVYRFLMNLENGYALSTSFPADIAAIVSLDLPTGFEIPKAQELFTEFFEYLIYEEFAKPHLGKHMPLESNGKKFNYETIFGTENFQRFKQAASQWAEASGYDIKNYPLINNLLKDIFKFDVAPVLLEKWRSNQPPTTDYNPVIGHLASQPALSEQGLSQRLINHIEQTKPVFFTTKQGIKIQAYLRELANTPKDVNNNTLPLPAPEAVDHHNATPNTQNDSAPNNNQPEKKRKKTSHCLSMFKSHRKDKHDEQKPAPRP